MIALYDVLEGLVLLALPHASTVPIRQHSVGPPEPSSCILPPNFAGEWNLDILSQEGFEKMKPIVTDI
jgi:hypothetical protein